jgi:hypothetical protein
MNDVASIIKCADQVKPAAARPEMKLCAAAIPIARCFANFPDRPGQPGHHQQRLNGHQMDGTPKSGYMIMHP